MSEIIIDYYNVKGKKPMIPVEFPDLLPNKPTLCLLDSGADVLLFPKHMDDFLGVDFTQADIITQGIQGITTELSGICYKLSHEIRIKNYPIHVDIYWTEDNRFSSPLIGRRSFFDKFDEVAFKEKIGLIILRTL